MSSNTPSTKLASQAQKKIQTFSELNKTKSFSRNQSQEVFCRGEFCFF